MLWIEYQRSQSWAKLWMMGTMLIGYSQHLTVKGTLAALRIFLYFLYVREYTKQDFSKSVAGIKMRTQTKIPSVWSKNEVLKLLDSIDRANGKSCTPAASERCWMGYD